MRKEISCIGKMDSFNTSNWVELIKIESFQSVSSIEEE